MKICMLAAGAAGMYCGSCLRDNALAGALMRAGHDVSLIPLYTPIRTDTPDFSIKNVYIGGVNAYLQYAAGIFRHTPRVLDWIFDRPWLLNLAGKYGAQTSPAKLGPFTLSILKGDEGPQFKELGRLMKFLKSDVKPEIVVLPNALFIGLARMLRDELGAPVVCELTGEDIFLDAMVEPFQRQAQEIIRERTHHVARFVATSKYYAGAMSEYLGLPPESIDVVYPGISREHLSGNGAGDRLLSPREGRAPTIGYFARICPEKGLDQLIDAVTILRRMPGMSEVRVSAAGYLGLAHERWFKSLTQRIQRDGLSDAFTYAGEVDLAGKLAFLDSVDVLSVPTVYKEPKGIYVLEALARGVPVVQPSHGAFPELISLTGGGLLAAPNDAKALATELAALLADKDRRLQLGGAGRAAVEGSFLDDHMAENMFEIFKSTLA